MTLRRSLPALLVTVVAAAAACGGGPSRASEIVAIDGSSTVFPITEAVAVALQETAPDLRVTIGESGSGSGFQKFCRGETVISNASRPIKPTEIDACAAAGIEFVELPIAYDGLSVVVHPDNTWASPMTVAELRTLWEPAAQGQVMRWSQVRPGWPDQEIRLYGPGTASGTFDYFTEAIVGEAQSSRGDYTASEDDNVLVQGISSDPNALGYFGLAYYEQNRDKLTLVAIDDSDATNGDGAIEPSFDTVRNGTYRPLSRPLFIYVSVAALERPEVQRFLDFYLQLDPQLIREAGYVTLADVEADLVRARLASRTTGTMFATASQTDSLEALLRGAR